MRRATRESRNGSRVSGRALKLRQLKKRKEGRENELENWKKGREKGDEREQR